METLLSSKNHGVPKLKNPSYQARHHFHNRQSADTFSRQNLTDRESPLRIFRYICSTSPTRTKDTLSFCSAGKRQFVTPLSVLGKLEAVDDDVLVMDGVLVTSATCGKKVSRSNPNCSYEEIIDACDEFGQLKIGSTGQELCSGYELDHRSEEQYPSRFLLSISKSEKQPSISITGISDYRPNTHPVRQVNAGTSSDTLSSSATQPVPPRPRPTYSQAIISPPQQRPTPDLLYSPQPLPVDLRPELPFLPQKTPWPTGTYLPQPPGFWPTPDSPSFPPPLPRYPPAPDLSILPRYPPAPVLSILPPSRYPPVPGLSSLPPSRYPPAPRFSILPPSRYPSARDLSSLPPSPYPPARDLSSLPPPLRPDSSTTTTAPTPSATTTASQPSATTTASQPSATTTAPPPSATTTARPPKSASSVTIVDPMSRKPVILPNRNPTSSGTVSGQGQQSMSTSGVTISGQGQQSMSTSGVTISGQGQQSRPAPGVTISGPPSNSTSGASSNARNRPWHPADDGIIGPDVFNEAKMAELIAGLGMDLPSGSSSENDWPFPFPRRTHRLPAFTATYKDPKKPSKKDSKK